MKISIITKTLLLFILIFSLNSCKTKAQLPVKKEVVSIQKDNFPKSWVGNYKGELEIYSVDSIAMTAQMNLDIVRKTDSIYNWKITYQIKGKEDVRAYELQIVDSKKGHYIIDEKNTIKIDAFYRNRIFTSFFEVMNSYIVATYTKQNNQIVFEIISASGKKTTTTGNAKHDGEDIPEVKTYFVNGRQKAILVKQ